MYFKDKYYYYVLKNVMHVIRDKQIKAYKN